jgi:anti-sigma B factor antagonist
MVIDRRYSNGATVGGLRHAGSSFRHSNCLVLQLQPVRFWQSPCVELPVNANEVISIQGRITVDNSGDMRRALCNALRAKPRTLTVDLSSVDYIDSSGFATLLEAMRNARKQNARLVLRGVQGQTRYFLEITRLDQLFDIESEEARA